MEEKKDMFLKSSDDFRKHGHEFIDWLANYYKNIEKYPVKSQVKPGEIKKKLPLNPPQKGEGIDSIFKDFEKIIMPGITHWQHPSFFAYFNANSSYPSLLAEMLTAGLGVNSMLWETSPAATELEERVMVWLRDMIGLPKDFKGVIQDTASTSTLCALICAREKATGLRINEKGFQAHQKLRVYVSDQGHSSIEKAAKIAGYGRENIVVIPSNGEFRMKPESLANALREDIGRQLTPACVVATVGTTSSTAIDPLEPIAEICSNFRTWLHVDAAHAGTAAILPEMRHILKGAERAYSLVFNPHKWLMTNFDCSAYFVRDAEFLQNTFSIQPEYLKTKADREVINYRDWGIQLGRRFRALKLWFVIRHYGVEGLQNIVRDHIKWAGDFAKWVDESKEFERLAPVTMNLVCFRLNPSKGKSRDDEAKLEELNKKLMDELNASGKIYLTHTKLKGKYSLRLCIGQTNTEFGHVQDAWRLLKEFAS
jgi:aromatic-L-amino-acid/L-tryptophan decarboxylase